MTKTTGTITFDRQGTSARAEIVKAMSVYTLVRVLSTGDVLRLRTDRMSGETHRGHATFKADK